MAHDAVTHDVVLARRDGPQRKFRIYERKFRIYGRPMPECGDMITLPVDGQVIRARVTVLSEKPEMDKSADAELVELV
jgi:hypothetical protein